jgi:flagella basal body P-ring formation protein FlgA
MMIKGRSGVLIRLVSLIALMVAGVAHAAVGVDSLHLEDSLRAEIQKRYPGMDIQLLGAAEWEAGSVRPSRLDRLTVLHEKRPGVMAFQVAGNNPETALPGLAVGSIAFTAKADAYIPKKRILPGEALQREDFIVQKVDVTTGFLAEVRGLLLGAQETLVGLEARNTLLEGQAVLSSAVQRIPLLKKGESVRLKVVAGGVALITQGVAEEPGQLNQKIRVTSIRTKRTLMGKLVEGGTVEVEL